MPLFSLTPIEARILGCLLEKERITPENYPLSLNALAAACNQTTNREPITAYDAKEVEAGVNALRENKLATVIFGAGSRVQKYRHNLLDHLELDRRDIALLCLLLLRGPQTLGELRGRTERLYHFASLEEVEACLADLAKDEAHLVRILPARPGQKEQRYAHLLSGEPVIFNQTPVERLATYAAPAEPVRNEPGLEHLTQEIAELKKQLHALREEFAIFRKQFE